ncbi:OLC1v1001733C1 [Oldenlandia corymbosa var. corymbosa]|uniref:OLC1v1001733C1 n=1 Tax=Oldenlandia corymbosa var. corymbosa TaxID=529605 RepID=A0AAV1D8V0_OLDCO|nr:OLC1v1001733C1 [Oldenlandia corymbosa var. corymbosa]
MKFKGLHLLYFITVFVTFMLSDALKLRQSNHIRKSIKSEDGDVIDCVEIFDQPAFDHPLLKNHTMKMKPSYGPEELFRDQDTMSASNANTKQKTITHVWQLSGECPDGTIPIRRTGKHDFLRNIFKFKKRHRNINNRPLSSSNGSDSVDIAVHEYAYSTVAMGGKYYGTKVTVSAWQPYVKNGLLVTSSAMLEGRGTSERFVVFPHLLWDNHTRLFSDDYTSTGCWNLMCSGFVQVSNEIVVGGAIANFSSDHLYSEISILVWKDQKQDVWWLKYNGTTVGYWPATLFNRLNDSAQLIECGGEIINSMINGTHTATQMGNGQFPNEKLERASYFMNIEIMNQTMALGPPPGGNILGTATNQDCYNISVGKNDTWGNFFYYGGPGRNPNCP